MKFKLAFLLEFNWNITKYSNIIWLFYGPMDLDFFLTISGVYFIHKNLNIGSKQKNFNIL